MPSSSRRARLAVLTAVTALAAAPAGVLAQDGAGDDQYTDPFSETTPSGATRTTIRPAPAPKKAAPRSAAPSAAAAAPANEADGSDAAAPAKAEDELANTGFDTRVLLLGGVALMVAGATLRLRLRSD